MPAARLPSNVIPCRPAHLVYLAELMRPDEQAQFLAVTGLPEFNADDAARNLIATASRSGVYTFTVVRANGMPAAAGGFEPCGPAGVWQSWMVGCAEGWAEQWRSLTKVTCWLMDMMFQAGAHRLQTNALATRTKAIEWFERSLRMRPEGVWRGYGTKGEDIAHFARLRGE